MLYWARYVFLFLLLLLVAYFVFLHIARDR